MNRQYTAAPSYATVTTLANATPHHVSAAGEGGRAVAAPAMAVAALVATVVPILSPDAVDTLDNIKTLVKEKIDELFSLACAEDMDKFGVPKGAKIKPIPEVTIMVQRKKSGDGEPVELEKPDSYVHEEGNSLVFVVGFCKVVEEAPLLCKKFREHMALKMKSVFRWNETLRDLKQALGICFDLKDVIRKGDAAVAEAYDSDNLHSGVSLGARRLIAEQIAADARSAGSRNGGGSLAVKITSRLVNLALPDLLVMWAAFHRGLENTPADAVRVVNAYGLLIKAADAQIKNAMSVVCRSEEAFSTLMDLAGAAYTKPADGSPDAELIRMTMAAALTVVFKQHTATGITTPPCVGNRLSLHVVLGACHHMLMPNAGVYNRSAAAGLALMAASSDGGSMLGVSTRAVMDAAVVSLGLASSVAGQSAPNPVLLSQRVPDPDRALVEWLEWVFSMARSLGDHSNRSYEAEVARVYGLLVEAYVAPSTAMPMNHGREAKLLGDIMTNSRLLITDGLKSSRTMGDTLQSDRVADRLICYGEIVSEVVTLNGFVKSVLVDDEAKTEREKRFNEEKRVARNAANRAASAANKAEGKKRKADDGDVTPPS
jgi:hypothetical protein